MPFDRLYVKTLSEVSMVEVVNGGIPVEQAFLLFDIFSDRHHG